MDFSSINMAEFLQTLSIWAIPVLFAITLHEAAHGYAAKMCGDNTAYMLGRVTLNPVKHIDPFGTVALPLLLVFIGSPAIIGYAKPVPVSFINLKNIRRDSVIVAGAGPAMNLLLALVSVGLIYVASILPNAGYAEALGKMAFASVQINVLIMVFNLLPILPLDGGRILHALLPGPLAYKFGLSERYGFIIILILLFSGVLWQIVGPIMKGLIIALLSLLPY